ncbi:hypothetical protein [Paramicrobacterium agarici]|uniref:hypothetical protein n=1 Tax=Paramicrobacterium agarici TaxID=630514 RepID=UPI00114F30C5|nr:hypothetical protein [Microbacterium agarici]TQO23359.1 hypothetical protein FB385_2209 [Microbacterium agarici]
MPGKIWLNMQDLEVVDNGLRIAITDFAEVADRNQDVADEVGTPYNLRDLADKVRDFEKDWNDNRQELSDGLGKLREHLHGIITAYHDYDGNLGSQLEPDEREALSNPGPDNSLPPGQAYV